MIDNSNFVIDMYERIYDEEHNYDDDYEEEFEDNQYYLGVCAYEKDIDGWLLTSTVKTSTFYHFTFYSIVDYLNNYSIINQQRDIMPDIMQLSFHSTEPFTMYTVIKKTFWLRLVQRTWKKIFKQRKNQLKNIINYLHERSLGFRQNPIPRLQGMLSYLKDNK